MEPASEGSGSKLPSVAELIREFLPLNRRRRHAHPALTERELARWEELRTLLERRLGVVPPPDAEARRRALRVPVSLPLAWAAGAVSGRGTTIDVSEGGVRFATQDPPRPRTPLFLALRRTADRPALELAGVVCWAQAPAGTEFMQVGVRFENLDADQDREITDLVENVISRV